MAVERFALAGSHLGDAALMQRDCAQELRIERALTQHAGGGLAHGGVGLAQQLIERLARRIALAEDGGHAAQLLVAQRVEFRLKLVDLFNGGAQARDFLFIRAAQPLFQKSEHDRPPYLCFKKPDTRGKAIARPARRSRPYDSFNFTILCAETQDKTCYIGCHCARSCDYYTSPRRRRYRPGVMPICFLNARLK